MSGKKPTHNLCVVEKDSDRGFQVVGAGWENQKGEISIKLNTGVILSWRDMSDHALYLFHRQARKDKRDGRSS